MGIIIFSLIQKCLASIREWIGNTFTANWTNLGNQITLLLSTFDESQTSIYDKEINQLPITAVYGVPDSQFADATMQPLYIYDGRLYCTGFSVQSHDTIQATFATEDCINYNLVSNARFGINQKSEYFNGYIYTGFYKVHYGDMFQPMKDADYQNRTSNYMIGINSQIDPLAPYTTIYDIASDGADIIRIASASKTIGGGDNTIKHIYVGPTPIQKSISHMLPEEAYYSITYQKYFYGYTNPSTASTSSGQTLFSKFPFWRTCSIAYNEVLYVQVHNLLYKLTSTNEIDKIYKLSFPVREMFVLNGYLHILTEDAVVKCNL